MLRNFWISLFCLVMCATAGSAKAESIARQWNEVLLEAIRKDYARPTVHARNLYHASAAMWDAWAAYDPNAIGVFYQGKKSSDIIEEARNKTISFAAYRILKHRFATSPGAEDSLKSFDILMDRFGYDPNITDIHSNNPASLGNKIGQIVINFGLQDGSNEIEEYAALKYRSPNRFHPLVPKLVGNSGLYKVNSWQPLAFDIFIDQSGNQLRGPPPFLGPHWGNVAPFALKMEDKRIYQKNGVDYQVYHDPGLPPLMGTDTDAEYHDGFMQVVEYSSFLDPENGQIIDISPNARGDSRLGTNDGSGRKINPKTGKAYKPQNVPAGDYYRVLAEFWADGPDSETPPGHWFGIANKVSDSSDLVKRIAGNNKILDPLEWDVKLYLALGGAAHDAAVAAWGIKGWYDYIRPISAVRYMAGWGQRDDPQRPNYDARGVSLVPGLVEVITIGTIAPGARHEHLGKASIGKIAVYAWRGPDYISNPEEDVAGVGWILLQKWWPYQRPTFVTPPFAGYVSGHSTFSRAAAEVLTGFTGDEYFPGGLGEFKAPKNNFLVFEQGPSVDVLLQWATYRDAADESAISRIFGGIHPRADDFPGRIIGERVGKDALTKAMSLYGNDFLD